MSELTLAPLLAALDGYLQDFSDVDGTLNWEHFCQSDSRRIFHGRGGCFAGLSWCTLDVFAPAFVVTLFKSPPAGVLEHFIAACNERFPATLCLLVQHRYAIDDRSGNGFEAVLGNPPESLYARWRGLRFQLSLQRQNIGFFLDIDPVRRWLAIEAPGKSLLNLFSYTCAFSVVARANGASRIVNIDMSHRALSTGKANHTLNQLPGNDIHFLPHNIFKSWGKLKKLGPYEIVIVDPPSYQPGSFVARTDYMKVVKRCVGLTQEGGAMVFCLNAPEVTAAEFQRWIDDVLTELSAGVSLEKTLSPSADFPSAEPERGLKMLVYRLGVAD